MYYAKIFDTKIGYFLYDAVTNSSVQISKKIYEILSNESYENLSENDIIYYKNYIIENNIRDITDPQDMSIDHSVTRNSIKKEISGNRNFITLSLTDECNMHCKYCVYYDKHELSIKSNNKSNQKSMTFETAKKAIDNLIKQSINLKSLHIGFYGGEGLLEFELIKKIIGYIEQSDIGIPINYGLTTNGILLINKDIRKYLIEKKMIVLLSLDGPESIHDRYRVMNDGRGSFQNIISALNLWYNENPEYVSKYVGINVVKAPPIHDTAVHDFFDGFPIGVAYSTMTPTQYFEKKNSCVNKYSTRVLDRGFFPYKEDYLLNYKKFFNKHNNLSNNIIPGGLCIPLFTRWFVNVKGEYYPCEKIDAIPEFCIGNVDDDVDYDKILNLYDSYIKSARNKCQNCWAIKLCGRCFANINKDCSEIKYILELEYIYYIENLKSNKEALKLLNNI